MRRVGLLLATAAIALPTTGDAHAWAPKGFVGTVLPFASRCATFDQAGNCLSDQDLGRMQLLRERRPVLARPDAEAGVASLQASRPLWKAAVTSASDQMRARPGP